MPEFQVVFLAVPQIGRTVPILYNGQRGDTAVVTNIETPKGKPGWYRVTTQDGNVCFGSLQVSSTTAMPPIQAQSPIYPPKNPGKYPKWLTLGIGIPAGCTVGCLGLLVFLVILGAVVGTTSSSEKPNRSANSNTTPASSDSSNAAPASNDNIHHIRYEVTGSASGASVTYTNADGGTSQENNVGVPWSRSFDVDDGDYTFLSISAQNEGEYGTITVTIYVDNTPFKTSSSAGEYAIADASGSL